MLALVALYLVGKSAEEAIPIFTHFLNAQSEYRQFFLEALEIVLPLVSQLPVALLARLTGSLSLFFLSRLAVKMLLLADLFLLSFLRPCISTHFVR